MAAPLAELHDVEAVWRALADDERSTALQLLGFASAVVRHKVPTVDARVAAGTLSDDVVRLVVAGMVARAMRNPDRVRSRQVGAVSVTFADPAPLGLDLTGEELALLAARPAAGVAGWGTIPVSFGLGYPPHQWT